MCGIAGFKVDRKISPNVLQAMLEKLTHRGPDSQGIYCDGPYQAGARRLAINDLSTGNQPLYSEDRSIVLLYNGEIYNAPQLRKELEKKGHRFSTHSDGEVVCHLYEEVGEKLFEHLDGMFAISLWSEREQKLILARDIPGEKPLYYYQLSDGEIIFASELKSLIAFPGLDLRLDRQALWDFPTFLWIPQPATIYEKIKSMPRSHFLVLDKNGIRIHSYKNRFGETVSRASESNLIAQTRNVVTQAVSSRLLSDVPVGCFLSGGLDSSIVATISSRQLPILHTFTVQFEDIADPYHGRANEARKAEWYAKKLKTQHVTVRANAKTFRESLEEFCWFGDQPFSVSSALGILAVSREAKKRGIKVLLSGDGADEAFGGYSWYPFLSGGAGSDTPSREEISFNNSIGVDLRIRMQALSRYQPQKRAWAWHYYASESEKIKLFSPDFRKKLKSSIRHFSKFKSKGKWSREDFIRQDREFYFPNEMLQKLDRMTMAHSVEGRVPFAAPSVQNFSDQLKFRYLVKGKTLKWILRQAFSPILPKEIVNRPKHGFNVPIDYWLKNGWNDLFHDTFNPKSSLVKAGILAEDSFETAKQMLYDSKKLHGHTLFSFVMLNMWLGQNGNNR